MRGAPVAAVVIIGAAYLHPLIFQPTSTFASDYSDFVAEHLPARIFLHREWSRTGELPRWNPYHFCGSPFIHDIQVGIFYPPYAVSFLLPEHQLGAAFSWMIAFHLLVAGLGAYWYARSHDGGEWASVVTAVGFMLSAKWMTHLLVAGHTITVGLAWLPWLLLAGEAGILRRNGLAVGAAGAVLALLVLGTHPQWAFYAVIFAIAWTFPPRRVERARWIGTWAGAGMIAFALTAVQLLPTWEAGQWSARRGGLDAASSWLIGWHTWLRLVGPPRSDGFPQAWEVQGWMGLFWLGAAFSAPLVSRGRTMWHFTIFCGLLIFSCGGAALIDWLPGFHLFRVPSRMLLIATFPLAFLAGRTTQALVLSAWSPFSLQQLARGFRRALIGAGLPTLIGLSLLQDGWWMPFVIYGVVVLVSLLLFVRILRLVGPTPAWRTRLWYAILAMDLLAPTVVFPTVRPQSELYPSSAILDSLAQAQPATTRVFDWDCGDSHTRASVLGIGAPQALVRQLPTPRGYNPLDVRHYRELMAMIVGDNRPVRGNSPYTQQVLPNFAVGHEPLFRLLCVTHYIGPVDTPPPPGVWQKRTVDPAPPATPPLLPHSPRILPPHQLWEAVDPQPRAWIVPHAVVVPKGQEFAYFQEYDFNYTVLLSEDSWPDHPPGRQPGRARIQDYQPHRLTVELDGTPGWLVLSEVWFPGWQATVDGEDVPVYRGDHAFRAVPVKAGSRMVVMEFRPPSYFWGWWISRGALVGWLGGMILALLIRLVSKLQGKIRTVIPQVETPASE
ncbi:MAG: YfhO family protein [Gemmataceae bacterium]|nr:YfhO family protein [Gemmata sp.]MDW8195980.1 YfhO family protein [Gemmataceae bacterium]